jgi:hypothetical protein
MVEYLIPAVLLGGVRIAEILGRPVIDFHGSAP